MKAKKTCLNNLIFLFFWLFILLISLLSHPNWLPINKIPQETDLIITHLPISVYISHILKNYYQIPLWNAFQFSGQPLIADPLAGYWYLPNWLTFAFPYPITFNFLFLIHFAWSGLGTFLFLRKIKMGEVTALFGAFVWMGTPKIIGYLAGGQVSSIFALSWMPWLLIVTQDLIEKLTLRSAIRSAAVLAVIILIDIRWGFFCALFVGVYYVSNINRTNFKKIFYQALIWMIITVLNTAILTLPLIEFMQFSRRAELSTQDVSLFSIELSSLLGVIAPQFGINYEQLIYFGLLPLIFMVFSITNKHRFWTLSACFCLLYSLGDNTFFFPLVNRIFPFLTWLRVPSRAWFFLVFSVIVLSSIGLHQVLTRDFSKTFKKKYKVVLVVLCTFAVLFAIGMRIIVGYIPSGIQFMAIMIPISTLLVYWLLNDNKNRRLQIFVLFVIVLSDLLIINNSILKSRPLPEKSDLVEWVENQPGLFRVYSPSYSFPMPNTLQQANGVNPMHLAVYAKFINLASNYSSGSYSVSLPDIYIDEHTPEELILEAQYPDTDLLGLLNVKYLASSFELKSPNLLFIDKIDNQFLYENQTFRERIWYKEGKVDLKKWSPNKIEFLTKGNAGKLILSEVYYPGWKAWVDGEEVEIHREYEIFRSVEIGSGSHEVIFKFVPISFFIGLFLSTVGWVGIFCIEIINRSKFGVRKR